MVSVTHLLERSLHAIKILLKIQTTSLMPSKKTNENQNIK
jgi:hypothetical protein